MIQDRLIKTVLVLGIASSSIYAQTNAAVSNQYSPGAIPYGAILGVRDPVVVGQPFSAEINARKIVRQPDGKKIVYECHGTIARDSQGRVRREQFPSPKVLRANGGRTISAVVVSDPLTGMQLHWSAASATVGQFPFSTATPSGKPEPLDACEYETGKTRSYPNGETQVIEFLGERTIQGISVRGCRVSTFIPAGAIQNDQAFTVTDDSWTSYELRLTLLKIHHDPSIEEDETVELDDVVRSEPDASLFQLPPNQQVKDAQ
jgi:hypothetical protein